MERAEDGEQEGLTEVLDTESSSNLAGFNDSKQHFCTSERDHR